MRTMKAKKELHLEHLKTETIAGVKKHFIPSVTLIKDRIDALVEREFLRRSEEDMNVFIYIA